MQLRFHRGCAVLPGTACRDQPGIGAAAQSAALEGVSGRPYPDGGSLAEIQVIQQAPADMDLATRQAPLLVIHSDERDPRRWTSC